MATRKYRKFGKKLTYGGLAWANLRHQVRRDKNRVKRSANHFFRSANRAMSGAARPALRRWSRRR